MSKQQSISQTLEQDETEDAFWNAETKSFSKILGFIREMVLK